MNRYFKKLILCAFIVLAVPLTSSTEPEEAASIEIYELCDLLNERSADGEGWVRRRRMELLKEGYKQEEIEAIIKKEREERAKSVKSETLETKLASYLKEKKLTLNETVKNIITKGLKNLKGKKEEERAEILEKTFESEALSHLKTLKQFSGSPEEDLKMVAAKWREWFFKYDIKKCAEYIKNAPIARAKLKEEQRLLKEFQLQKMALMKLTSSILSSKKVTKTHSSYKEIFDREFAIQLEAESLTGDAKEKKIKEMRLAYLNELISKNRLVSEADTEGRKAVLLKIEEIFYLDSSKAKQIIRKILKIFHKEKYKKVLATCKEFIASKEGLSEKLKKKLLAMEFQIEKDLFNLKGDKRAKESELLHLVAADQMVRVDGVDIVGIYAAKYREFIIKDITKQWRDWLYLPDLPKVTKLRHLRDVAELNSITDPFIKDFKKLKIETVTDKLISFKKEVMTALKLYQKSDIQITKRGNEKIIAAFKKQIRLSKKSPEKQLELMEYYNRFLELGFCPQTDDAEIEKEKAKALEKKLENYERFTKTYEKRKKSFLPVLVREAKKKGKTQKRCLELSKKFIAFDRFYTQLGNKFSQATISITKPYTNGEKLKEMKVFVDEVEVKGFIYSAKLTNKKTFTTGDGYIVKVPLRMGQKIRVELVRCAQLYYTRDDLSVVCHISLAGNHAFIPCNKKTWKRTLPEGAILKESKKDGIVVIDSEGRKITSHGMIFDYKAKINQYTTEIVPANIIFPRILTAAEREKVLAKKKKTAEDKNNAKNNEGKNSKGSKSKKERKEEAAKRRREKNKKKKK